MTSKGGENLSSQTAAQRAGLLAVLALCLSIGGAISAAAAQAVAPAANPANIAEAVVSIGKSQIIQSPVAYSDAMIADPKIADLMPLGPNSLYVVGKSIGSTALTLYGPNRRLIASINVVVSPDIDGLRLRLGELLPQEHAIVVSPANQSIVLSGTVGSPAALQRVLALGESYAPGKVVNLLGVEGTQQVMLSVRFVEMQRTVAKDLRVNIQRPDSPGLNPPFQITTGDVLNGGSTVLTGTFGSLLSRIRGDGDLNLLFDALETKGVVKTLAEPTLVAMSGDTASFLAGGEFPIPVAQSSSAGGSSSIAIEFKQFGVSLAFTPTLLSDGLINLSVNPEVSSIDPNTSVSLGSIRVPGIKVRRAHTTVELRDGESFTIAGLLKDDFNGQIRQFPFIGDIPVLGAMFRSNGYQKDQTELVIVVTPHLVTPRKGVVATPADYFTPSSDLQRFLNGALETTATATTAPKADGHVLQ